MKTGWDRPPSRMRLIARDQATRKPARANPHTLGSAPSVCVHVCSLHINRLCTTSAYIYAYICGYIIYIIHTYIHTYMYIYAYAYIYMIYSSIYLIIYKYKYIYIHLFVHLYMSLSLSLPLPGIRVIHITLTVAM